MRDPDRIDIILKELGDIWKKYPDLRFCQMMHVIVDFAIKDTYDLEDSCFLKMIEKFNTQDSNE